MINNLLQKILPLTTFLFLVNNIYSQNDSFSDYVITNNNDTIYGKITDRKDGFMPVLLKKIRLKQKGVFFKKRFSPNKIRAYKTQNGNFITMNISSKVKHLKLEYFNNPYEEKQFVKLLSDGPLKHLRTEHVDQDNHSIETIDYLKLKSSNKLVRTHQGLFGLKRKSLINYFNDCILLKEAIKNKQVNTIVEIIAFYNKSCI